MSDETLQERAVRSAQRFLAARDLLSAWEDAMETGLPLRVNADARLVFGTRIQEARERAAAELYRDLSRLGEPVDTCGRQLRVGTETGTIVIDPRLAIYTGEDDPCFA